EVGEHSHAEQVEGDTTGVVDHQAPEDIQAERDTAGLGNEGLGAAPARRRGGRRRRVFPCPCPRRRLRCGCLVPKSSWMPCIPGNVSHPFAYERGVDDQSGRSARAKMTQRKVEAMPDYTDSPPIRKRRMFKFVGGLGSLVQFMGVVALGGA